MRRLLGAWLTLFCIVSVSFFIVRLAPGGPFDQEQAIPASIRANLGRLYGLDQPLGIQYLHYLEGLLHGDFGPSFKLRDFSVGELIAQGLPLSLTLAAAAIALALGLGLPLGVLAASRRNSLTDLAITSATMLGVALPSFVIGPLLALVVGLYWHWLPVAGWDEGAPRYLVLPVITLALPVMAYIARIIRGSLLEVLRTHYIQAARARGLGEGRVIWRHALRPALLPVMSYLGPAAAYVVTGSLVVETVFALPGTGRYLIQGAINRDYTLVMGMITVYGALTVGFNLIVDLLYGWLDPTVRHE